MTLPPNAGLTQQQAEPSDGAQGPRVREPSEGTRAQEKMCLQVGSGNGAARNPEQTVQKHLI